MTFRCVLLWLFNITAFCQAAEFINLGFEDADLRNLRPVPENPTIFFSSTEELVPGWHITQDLQDVRYVTYNNLYTPLSPAFLRHLPASPDSQRGQNDLAIFGLVPDPDNEWHFTSVHVFQNGRIPADAIEMRYNVTAPGTELRIDGDLQIPTQVPWPPNPGVIPYNSVDVSKYAGRDVTMDFFFGGAASGTLDVYGFFPPVPEPSSWALVAIGLASLCWVARLRVKI